MNAILKTFIIAIVLYFSVNFPLRGDIVRCDNGEIIPGTEHIVPGPRTSFAGLDIEKADLRELDLTEADFTAASAWDACFNNSILVGANFRNAELDGADFTDADLTHATLFDAYGAANFSGAGLRGADFTAFHDDGESDFTNAHVQHAGLGPLITREQLYSTASYQTNDLRGIRLLRETYDGWDFSGQDLTGGTFFSPTGADLTDAIVERAFLSGLTSEQLASTASYKAKQLKGVSFWVEDEIDLSGQDLTGASFNANRVDLTDAVVAYAGLPRNLSAEQLYSTASYKAKQLQGIVLNILGDDQLDVDLRAQNLTNARLTGLPDVDLRGAIITGASLPRITSEQLYSTASYQQHQLIGITLHDVSGFDLSGQNLTRASLKRLDGADVSDTNLSNARLIEANFAGANLANTNLFGATLKGATDFVPLDSTDTRNAILPNGEIAGLDIRNGEVVSYPPVFGPSPSVMVKDKFVVESGATLELVATQGFITDPPVNAELSPDENTPIQLGGTLRVIVFGHPLGHFPTKHTLFNWPQTLEPGNEFDAIDLPAGGWDTSSLYSTGEIVWNRRYLFDGDFNVDGLLDASDIDRLSKAIRVGRDGSYDVNADKVLDQRDRTYWVHEFKQTWFGDANLDGTFSSDDLVTVFQAGEYEDAFSMNSTWVTGDWNGDGEFDSGDFVTAFQDGGYEQGPRVELATVPEPKGWTVLLAGLFGITPITRKRL